MNSRHCIVRDERAGPAAATDRWIDTPAARDDKRTNVKSALSEPGDHREGTSPAADESILRRCLWRARRWTKPANWSARDWFEEARACAAEAAWQAHRDFDPSRAVPEEAFVYQRIMTSVLTRYRQEWSYARRAAPLSNRFHASNDSSPLRSDATSETVRRVLDQLDERDRRIVELSYWQNFTETQIGRRLGVSQQAVSKRKKQILARAIALAHRCEN